MKQLGLNELRSMFREFFVSKDHYPAKSASLIPKNDKSLLIINSGMAPLKPYFSGAETPPSKRMTTCQKCIRTGDIENVGITARHGTFFEMLGNFSFGDYFKRESLNWGWEFITKWLELPEDKLWATIYENDEEAHDIWREIGMPEEKIVRLGKDDNFWEIGLGPCGPCSEIYYDRGEKYGCGRPDCKPGCDCDRYIEFWNHVFTQYSKEPDGSYSDLEHKNIDTGLGLERIACIMQSVDSIFDIDTVRHILNGVVKLSGKSYETGNVKNDISIRIITDHLRSMVFMIADDIRPSNEGRGYVLRRLIRRAIRHGKLLGIEGTFLSDLAEKVIEVSGEAYPELVERRDFIKKTIKSEEERFEKTLDQGMGIIDDYLKDMKSNGSAVLDGERVFKLYDTYGFPVEMTEEIMKENGFTIDMDGFEKRMEEQRETGRSNVNFTEDDAWKDAAPSDLDETVFTGYDETKTIATVLAVYKNGAEADSAEKGDTAVVYLDKTPFYTESGGQVSDNGFMSTNTFDSVVTELKKNNGLVAHTIRVTEGRIEKGMKVGCFVNIYKRNSTARNHTATHLLQAALREVLGSHVEQSGSRNDENTLRFDFTHFEAMTPEQLNDVEMLVNQKIMEFIPVTTEVMSLEEAKASGAMALFSEKYGDEVRVVKCGDFSTELCGGTHVANTGEIGAFRIVSETGIAAGIRRIEAVTGMGIFLREKKADQLINAVSGTFKTTPENLETKAAQTADELKALRKEIAKVKKDSMFSGVDGMISSAKDINGVRLITAKFEDTDTADLRELADRIKEKVKKTVVVLASDNDGKVVLIVTVTDDLLDQGYHAGKLIKEIAKTVGGGGGGKADMAQAGGKDPSGIQKAFEYAEMLIS